MLSSKTKAAINFDRFLDTQYVDFTESIALEGMAASYSVSQDGEVSFMPENVQRHI